MLYQISKSSICGGTSCRGCPIGRGDWRSEDVSCCDKPEIGSCLLSVFRRIRGREFTRPDSECGEQRSGTHPGITEDLVHKTKLPVVPSTGTPGAGVSG